MIKLADRFHNIVSRFTKDEQLIATCWREIATAYSLPERHYHTLQHIEQMLVLLEEVREDCTDPEAIQLAIFYHDIVYDAGKQDNEAQSALVARKRLTAIGYKDIDKVEALILATKKHESTGDKDTDYLLDIDLSILGAGWSRYEIYARQVREEYRIYPDAVYNPGRVRVLQHFLSLKRIFKTAHFFEKLERQARINLEKEIAVLS